MSGFARSRPQRRRSRRYAIERMLVAMVIVALAFAAIELVFAMPWAVLVRP